MFQVSSYGHYVFILYIFPNVYRRFSKLSDPTWWEVNQQWFLTDVSDLTIYCERWTTIPVMVYLQIEFIIWPRNLLWEVSQQWVLTDLSDLAIYCEKWTTIPDMVYLQIEFIIWPHLVGGVPAMGPYRFIWPHN